MNTVAATALYSAFWSATTRARDLRREAMECRAAAEKREVDAVHHERVASQFREAITSLTGDPSWAPPASTQRAPGMFDPPDTEPA